MKILYLHGLGSGPGGFKQTFLEQQGFEVIAPAMPDEDFAASVRIAQAAFDAAAADVVVGSSRGGAVAMNLDTGQTPLVLIAPAWRRCGGASTVKPGTRILHSPHDELIPINDSRELVRRSGLEPDALWEIGERHGMSDEPALAALVETIRRVAGT